MNTAPDAKEAARQLFASKLADGWKPGGLWTYTDASGAALFHRARLDPPAGSDEDKFIRPFYLNGKGYKIGEPQFKDGKPLYLAHRLAGAPNAPVFIVEGEKCADALVKLGILATTSGGASSASGADWTLLARRRVIIWPDNDEPGARYALDVCAKLQGIEASVEVLDVATLNLPVGGDCVDWLAAHPDATADVVAKLTRVAVATPATDWPTPEPLGAIFEPEPLLPELAPPIPFPMDALPPILRAAAEAIAEHVKAPPVLAAHAVIGAAAHLAQARVNAPHLHKPDGMPCSLFLLTLADSGDRKSECQRLAFKIIDEAEREGRRQWQSECRRIKAEHRGDSKKKPKGETPPMPPDPRTVYASDASFSKIVANFIHGQSYASWSTDEGGQFFGGHSMVSDTRTATLGGLVRLFDTGYTERDRASNNLDGSGFAYGRRLSILLLAQEIAVRAALSDPLLQGQGFLPRFLFASASSLAGTRFLSAEDLGRKSYGDARLQRFWERCRDILEYPITADEEGVLAPPVLALDDSARSAWLDFYNRTESAQAPLQEMDALKPFAGRAGELGRRVAAVLAFFERKPVIDADIMRQACKIVEHSLSEWVRYTDAARVDPTAQTAHHLMQWLQAPKRAARWQSFTVDEIGKSGPPAVRSARHRDRVLALLVERRHLFTTDGKRFHIAPPADSADSAESLVATGLSRAENLRRVADFRGVPESAPTQSAEIRSLPQKIRNLKRDHSDVSAESAKSSDPPSAKAHEGGLIEIEL